MIRPKTHRAYFIRFNLVVLAILITILFIISSCTCKRYVQVEKVTQDTYRGKVKVCFVGSIPNQNEFRHNPAPVKTKATKKMLKEYKEGERYFFINCKKVYLQNTTNK